ncbi:short chain dehydrogenase/reductase [Lophium mytilinum]|uniref:Short chain dehydrogenase/reductase n=1 Tax=Lophium mytilinum TaxID=390894 RepID=A0A6A6QG54_9PEZI|nr:short chain dehydrogenase/reductase [Lophium mytilinum]
MATTIVLITGANSGIGFATSKVLACASSTFHIIIASRSLEKAEAAKSTIEAASPKGSLSTVVFDVTDEESIEATAALVQQQFGRLDVLVNNAGSGSMDMDLKARFQLCLNTNVIGPALVAAAFRPLLLKSQNPYSIFVSSGERTLTRNAHEKPASHAGIKNGDAYQVSKAALNMLAILEARDYGPQGLKVFAMSPGFVRSNLRGTSEEARSGWGRAGDPEVSGELVLSIVEGKRDGDVGLFVHRDGVYSW